MQVGEKLSFRSQDKMCSMFPAEIATARSLPGSIPPELGNLPALGYFYLTGNQLSGEL